MCTRAFASFAGRSTDYMQQLRQLLAAGQGGEPDYPSLARLQLDYRDAKRLPYTVSATLRPLRARPLPDTRASQGGVVVA